MVVIRCSGCGYEWNYTGRKQIRKGEYVCCPRCKSSLSLHKNVVRGTE